MTAQPGIVEPDVDPAACASALSGLGISSSSGVCTALQDSTTDSGIDPYITSLPDAPTDIPLTALPAVLQTALAGCDANGSCNLLSADFGFDGTITPTKLSDASYGYDTTYTSGNDTATIIKIQPFVDIDQFGIPLNVKNQGGDTALTSWSTPVILDGGAPMGYMYDDYETFTTGQIAGTETTQTNSGGCSATCDTNGSCVGFNYNETNDACVLYGAGATKTMQPDSLSHAYSKVTVPPAGYFSNTNPLDFNSDSTWSLTDATYTIYDSTQIGSGRHWNYATSVQSLIYEVSKRASRWYEITKSLYPTVITYNNTGTSTLVPNLTNLDPNMNVVQSGSRGSTVFYSIAITVNDPNEVRPGTLRNTINLTGRHYDDDGQTCVDVKACNVTIKKLFSDSTVTSFATKDIKACRGCSPRSASRQAINKWNIFYERVNTKFHMTSSYDNVLRTVCPSVKLFHNRGPVGTGQYGVTYGGIRTYTIDGYVPFSSYYTNQINTIAKSITSTNNYQGSVLTWMTPTPIYLLSSSHITLIPYEDEGCRHASTSAVNVIDVSDANARELMWYMYNSNSYSSSVTTPINCVVQYAGPYIQSDGVSWVNCPAVGCADTHTAEGFITTMPQNGGTACPPITKTRICPSVSGCAVLTGYPNYSRLIWPVTSSGMTDWAADKAKYGTLDGDKEIETSYTGTYKLFLYYGGVLYQYQNPLNYIYTYGIISSPTQITKPNPADISATPMLWNNVEYISGLTRNKYRTYSGITANDAITGLLGPYRAAGDNFATYYSVTGVTPYIHTKTMRDKFPEFMLSAMTKPSMDSSAVDCTQSTVLHYGATISQYNTSCVPTCILSGKDPFASSVAYTPGDKKCAVTCLAGTGIEQAQVSGQCNKIFLSASMSFVANSNVLIRDEYLLEFTGSMLTFKNTTSGHTIYSLGASASEQSGTSIVATTGQFNSGTGLLSVSVTWQSYVQTGRNSGYMRTDVINYPSSLPTGASAYSPFTLAITEHHNLVIKDRDGVIAWVADESGGYTDRRVGYDQVGRDGISESVPARYGGTPYDIFGINFYTMNNQDIPGNTISAFAIDSSEGCARACINNSACKAFMYDNNGACYLKNTDITVPFSNRIVYVKKT
jgi:hypothetical protein